jgi:hypothetical protein
MGLWPPKSLSVFFVLFFFLTCPKLAYAKKERKMGLIICFDSMPYKFFFFFFFNFFNF